MNGDGGDGKTELQERDLDPEQASVSGAEHKKNTHEVCRAQF